MFIQHAHQLVAETTQLPALVLSVSSGFVLLCVEAYSEAVFAIAPSMFGRDLIEQVRADAKGEERYIPIIVEKCIDAVDTLGELLFLSFDAFRSF